MLSTLELVFGLQLFYALLEPTISQQVLQSAHLAPDSVSTANGISVSTGPGVHIANNNWNINVATQQGIDLNISMTSEWAFHPSLPSTLQLYLHGHTPNDTYMNDGEIVFIFAAENTYFAQVISLDRKKIAYKECPASNTPLIARNVSQMISSLTPDRFHRFCGNDISTPINDAVDYWNNVASVYKQAAQWPMAITIVNDPILNTISYSWSDSVDAVTNKVESHFTSSFAANSGFNIFISGESPNENFVLYYIDVTYSVNSLNPTAEPTVEPTYVGANNPTLEPTTNPTMLLSINPSSSPTETSMPTMLPTLRPTLGTTTFYPTRKPTVPPTIYPTMTPSRQPTDNPTDNPTEIPTSRPIIEPTVYPSLNPSVSPTDIATLHPSMQPISSPTLQSTLEPSRKATFYPSSRPSFHPTHSPTLQPTSYPTISPTKYPTTLKPTIIPTQNPTHYPTTNPSMTPSKLPSIAPSTQPTNNPTSQPTFKPTMSPSTNPTINPSFAPTISPSNTPNIQPTSNPTNTLIPTAAPSIATTLPSISQTNGANTTLLHHTLSAQNLNNSNALKSMDLLAIALVILVAVCVLSSVVLSVFVLKKQCSAKNEYHGSMSHLEGKTKDIVHQSVDMDSGDCTDRMSDKSNAVFLDKLNVQISREDTLNLSPSIPSIPSNLSTPPYKVLYCDFESKEHIINKLILATKESKYTTHVNDINIV